MRQILVTLIVLLLVFIGCKKEVEEKKTKTEIMPLFAKKKIGGRVISTEALVPGPAPDLRIVTEMEYGTGAPGALYGTVGDPLLRQLDLQFRQVAGGGYLNKVLKIDSGMRWVLETNCPVDNIRPLPAGANPREWGWFMLRSDSSWYDSRTRRTYWDSVLEVKQVWEGAYRNTLHKDSYNFSINCHPSVPNCDQFSYGADTMALYWGGMDLYSLYQDVGRYIGPDTAFVVWQVIINWGTAWDETDYSNNHAFVPIVILPNGAGAYVDVSGQAWNRAVKASAPRNIVQQWPSRNFLNLSWDGGGIMWEVYIDNTLVQRSDLKTYSGNIPKKAKTITLKSIGEFEGSDSVPVTVNMTR